MRYWFDGEDEDYERELQRVSRCGGAPPAPIAPLHMACFALLVAFQTIGLILAVLAFAD